METINVVTGKNRLPRYDAFLWGKLFGINFARCGYRLRPWSFSSGPTGRSIPTICGRYFGARRWRWKRYWPSSRNKSTLSACSFGWQRLNKYQHLLVTAGGLRPNISALCDSECHGWMQHPTGAHFNIDTLRMEMSSFSDLVFNPVSRVKFVHGHRHVRLCHRRHVYYVHQRRYLLHVAASVKWPCARLLSAQYSAPPPFWEPCNWGQFASPKFSR